MSTEGLQQISASVGDVVGGSYDMRNKESKASDEAGTAIRGMGKSAYPPCFLLLFSPSSMHAILFS